MCKIVVITGGSGYIGRELTRSLLKEGWEIHLIVRKNSDLNCLRDIEHQIHIFRYENEIQTLIDYFKELKKIDVVIHLASLFLSDHSYNQVNDLIQSNIQFGTHILESMRQVGCDTFINTSTTWQHYNNEIYNPVCFYAATKEAFEKLIDYYVQVCGVRCITLEIFDTYGVNDSRGKVINLLKKCYETKEYLGMSPGEQKIDLVYIEDVVEAYRQSIQLINTHKNTHLKYSIKSNKSVTLKELVSCINRVVGDELNIAFGERPYREREVMETSNNVPVLPNWLAKYTLEDGLKKIFIRQQ